MAIATRGGRTFDRVGHVRHLSSPPAPLSRPPPMAGSSATSYHYGKHTATWKIVHTTDGGRNWTTQYAR